ncbi:MAG: hypothetical protein ACRDPM_13280, partial [Solirubrobacteraceae bacterium]
MKRFASHLAVVTAVAACVAPALVHGAAGASSRAAAGALPTISITMDGKSIAVAGALQSGAVDVHSTVSGEPFGSPALVRLNPGVTYAQFFAALQTRAVGQDPNAISPFASLVFDAAATPGTSDAQT